MIRSRCVLMLAVLALGLLPSVAEARFVDGYLAECSAVAAGACTEFTSAGYARQPVSFNTAARGVSPLSTPYTFGLAFSGVVAGRGVYDAPTGGNLLFVIPLAAPMTVSATPGDFGDVGSLQVTFAALTGLQNGDVYTGRAAAAAAIGTTRDGSTVTAGVALSINRGVLQASATVPQGSE